MKIIQIDDCLECPWVGKKNRYCYEHQMWIDMNELPIPEWCELMDKDAKQDQNQDPLETMGSAFNTHEYAYDVTLAAVIRVRARTEEEALDIIETHVDGTNVEELQATTTAWLTEFSLEGGMNPPHLFEVDGKAVE